MMYENALTAADVAAVTRNNDNNNGMFGNDWAWIVILLIFGWGGNGFGGWGGAGNAGGALTRADLCQDMNFQGVENGIRGISQGICDSTFALNNTITNGFHNVDNAICNLGYTVQQGFNATQMGYMQGQNALQAQIAQCCCDNRMGQADIKYQMATDTCAIQNTIQNTTRDIVDNANANSRAILDFLTQDKIATLTAENQSLKFAASQSAQNAFITANQEAQTAELIRRLGRDCPIPAYVVPNPNCCYPNTGCGCGNF